MARTAVVAGVGPGLGASIARRFADEGCAVGLFARSPDVIGRVADEIGDGALAVPTDVSDPGDVREGFDAVREAFGPVDVLVVNASRAPWKGTLEIGHDEFDRALDVNVRGGLYCVQEAVGDMLGGDGDGEGDGEGGGDGDGEGDGGGDGGTVIFTGATTAVRGREGAIGFSAAKFAARGMAESMARELGPEGVHVAHVVIDGQILPPGRDVDDESEYLDPDAIAATYWDLVEQDRSAWTLELDLRPHVEEF